MPNKNKQNPNDNIIRHFILVALLLIDTLFEVIHDLIILPMEELKNEKAFQHNKLEEEEERVNLMKKTNQELRNMLNGVQNLSKLNKAQLVDRIISRH